jgi:ribose transport system permease protein
MTATQAPAAAGLADHEGEDRLLDDALSHEEELKLAPGSPAQAAWRRHLARRNMTILLAAIAVFALFSITTSTFLTWFNLANMGRNVSLIGIVAVGMTLLFVVGEIDLSVGSLLGLLTLCLGIIVVDWQASPLLGAAVVVALGLLLGLFAGLIRILTNIPSFIVTLALLTAYRSLTLIISGERPRAADPQGSFFDLTGGAVLHVPWLAVWMLTVMALGGFVLERTRFGYHAYATGGNLRAARQSGIRTDRIKVLAFGITGTLVGFAAALLFGYLHVAEATTGTGFEFRVIGAVVVGGCALTGGQGTVFGTLLGTLIIGMITTGMVLLGFSQNMGDVANGALIIGVGSIDLLLRRASRRQG